MMMSLKQKWIDALRSGKYEQAKGRLKKEYDDRGRLLNEPQYCCLGVLIEISDEDMSPANGVDLVNGEDWERHFKSIANSVSLDYIVSEFGTEMDTRNAQDQLANLNDRGVGFSKIADFIEEFVVEVDNG
jgi:hypothetical protein